MAKKYFLILWIVSVVLLSGGAWTVAQDDSSRIRVNVVLVQVNVAVTDRKGNYVSGLRPEDFAITEDKIPESISTFEEGNEGTIRPATQHGATADKMVEAGQTDSAQLPAKSISQFAGANVFILFDTSNYMYRGFVF